MADHLFHSKQRSFSRLTAYEAARILYRIGAEVRVMDPQGLPMKDDVSENHKKVLEIRALAEHCDAMLWVSPEQHGTITAVMKNQSGSMQTCTRSTEGSLLPAYYPQLTGYRCLRVQFGQLKVEPSPCVK